jgi:hypothetical protein
MKSCLVTASVFCLLLPWTLRAERPESAETDPGADDLRLASTLLDPPILEPTEPFAVQEQPLFEKQPRTGMVQSLRFSTGVVAADTDQLSLVELDFSATLGFPMPSRASPLLVTASVGTSLLGAENLDLPNELYDVAVELRYLRPLGDRWTADLAVAPGVYGNLETSEKKVRIQGRAIGIFQWRPDTKLAMGVVYLDRETISLLPAAGLIWTPTDYLKFDILFPRPRIALRGAGDCCSAWWLYLGGEFGGGSWGVTRADGSGDVATLGDLRLLVGLERQAHLLGFKAEAGYVFSRELSYASGIGDVDLGNAALARLVLAY